MSIQALTDKLVAGGQFSANATDSVDNATRAPK
jgi:hypothetical protein